MTTINRRLLSFKQILGKYFSLDFCIILIAVIGALIVRLFGLPYINGDFVNFLEPWSFHLKNNRGFTGWSNKNLWRCRRRFKTGFVACSKPDSLIEPVGS